MGSLVALYRLTRKKKLPAGFQHERHHHRTSNREAFGLKLRRLSSQSAAVLTKRRILYEAPVLSR
ncbi:hypothetical protein K450DRAFT_260983 [Umbelopsis ramanniana AG]|uniref:Uncharacterized protein n=1 Tax=Umbelopsis ramanniana AG TaxID=1314678 RepID=A0AAD5H869_UMBRA|nr:uncharacterized protein K450DRAFT_260983 [Umbelopsis ramanniana AG]KAI8575625.1 hypothetical protein K450DRAFT_260983 [Umbelopsis ramanniana AG]